MAAARLGLCRARCCSAAPPRCGPGTGSAPLPARSLPPRRPRGRLSPSGCGRRRSSKQRTCLEVHTAFIRGVGANRIYAGQMAVLGRSSVGPIIQQMWNQEKDHLKKFSELMVAYRVRPTVLLPFWNVAGFSGTPCLG
uniref:Coenzyme Q7, hydroxylase n=1 Tax=Malurus cyaneus samueli TaxID=2593467 RepID=A0A8C5U873_9PASS